MLEENEAGYRASIGGLNDYVGGMKLIGSFASAIQYIDVFVDVLMDK